MADKFAVNDAFIRIYNSLVESKAIKSKGALAEMMGIKPSTLSEIVAKRQGITVEFIQTFCQVFPNVTPNDFFDLKTADRSDAIIELQAEVIRLQGELLAMKRNENI
ncbi:helix-turn-helix domain-containing protein [Dyadobacter luticola]|uniref:Helix-turn-helix transcriptional regulator n=1 Tax=Dyadobacter luticola TaxID=1979387 RepID=A0A5R9KSA1_9BACT|nr:helix-turn-helix transcriptional regulator [Dyadobacter luticola]TLU99155.1 helix-turn-helix transcriptional regulator [Dyadobacter luticola]